MDDPKNAGAKLEDTTPPTKITGTQPKVNEQLSGLSFDQYFSEINKCRFDTGFDLAGKTDADKLMPGEGDYYDVLAKMGRPVQKVSDTVMRIVADKKAGNLKDKPDFKMTNALKNPWTFGQESAQYTAALRRKDMDTYRITHFKDWFDKNKPPGFTGDFVFETMEIDTASRNKVRAIDVIATIKKYRGVPNIESLMYQAEEDFYKTVKKTPNGDKLINMEHWKALESARTATVGCSCQRGFPLHLKKTKKRALKSKKKSKIARSKELRAMRMAELGLS
jgi:hypothetical protein